MQISLLFLIDFMHILFYSVDFMLIISCIRNVYTGANSYDIEKKHHYLWCRCNKTIVMYIINKKAIITD